MGSCPTAKELAEAAAHLATNRGSCEAVAAPWLQACNEQRATADANNFLLPPEALGSVARYRQVGFRQDLNTCQCSMARKLLNFSASDAEDFLLPLEALGNAARFR